MLSFSSQRTAQQSSRIFPKSAPTSPVSQKPPDSSIPQHSPETAPNSPARSSFPPPAQSHENSAAPPPLPSPAPTPRYNAPAAKSTHCKPQSPATASPKPRSRSPAQACQ